MTTRHDVDDLLAHDEQVSKDVSQWLEQVVIGLGLCPFARAPYVRGLVHLDPCPASDFDEAITQTLDAIDELLARDPSTRSTTLCIFPHAFDDFDEFLEAIEVLEDLLARVGAQELVQLAHFHPGYLFEGEPEDAVSHYTNRSPYPILHLLRVEEVADAITSSPDVHEIPARNIATLEGLEARTLRALFEPKG